MTSASNNVNIVVIPPGDPLFVKKRVQIDMNVAGINVSNLAMFEDVTFPNPNLSYGTSDCDNDTEDEGTCVGGVETNDALTYVNQTFGFGDIFTLRGQTVSGLTVTSTTGLCASGSGNQVKKFSASGSVNPDCAAFSRLALDFQTMSVSGVRIGGFPVSLNFNYATQGEPRLTASMGLQFELLSVATLSTGLSINPANLGGFSLRLATEALNLNLSFTNFFKLTGLSANFGHTFTVGSLVTAFSANVAGQAGTGLNVISMALSVSQGTFSANHSVAWTRQQIGTDGGGDPVFGLSFSRFNLRFNLRFSPAVISMEATFGSGGLTRFALITGLVF